MTTTKLCGLLAGLGLLYALLPSAAQAQPPSIYDFGDGPIDFENTSVSGTPFSDNFGIDGAIFRSQGSDIVFSFASGTPTIEDATPTETRIGSTQEETDNSPFGFVTGNDGDPASDTVDTPRNGFTGTGLDEFFLRNEPALSSDLTLTLEWVNGTGTDQLSFQLWDIDGSSSGRSEQYTVSFFSGTELLGTVATPEVFVSGLTSLDGLPFTVAFASPDLRLIDEVVIEFTGTKLSGVGVAFDNFDPARIPEPGAGTLAAMAALGFLARRKR